MAKPDRTDVVHAMVAIRLTAWEKVGLDLLVARESAGLSAKLQAAGVPERYVAPLTAATVVRGLIQREIEAAGLDVAELKRRAETTYPRPVAQPSGPSPTTPTAPPHRRRTATTPSTVTAPRAGRAVRKPSR